MTENIAYGIEILVGLMAVPWLTWVTVSIFSLRQSVALMKQENQILQRMEGLMIKMAEKGGAL